MRIGALLLSLPVGLMASRDSVWAGAPGLKPRIAILHTTPAGDVARFGKLEVTFTVNTKALHLHWPYDPAPPAGITGSAGITVEGVLVDPDGKQYRQPAFYYQRFVDEAHNGRDWHYPTSEFVWKLRFSPNRVGPWKYQIHVHDRDGVVRSDWRSFTVTSSAHHGFVRVSRADRRYFEFDDGTFFTGLGFQLPEYLEDPATRGEPAYRQLHDNGVNFVRLWVSSLYGSAWNPYIGGRNRYGGYLPITGLVPFRNDATGETTLAMRMDYEPGGDLGWFDACRLQGWNDAEAVKPHTRYQVRATYRATKIAGPRNPRFPNFGFIVKLGGMFPNCYEPGTSRPVTTYGPSNTSSQQIEGVWNSGTRYFLPKLHLAVENVTAGEVYVESVSVREILPDGGYGPEILVRPSMAHQQYIPQARAYALDKIVELAERYGVYLKLVVMEKGDEIYLKIGDRGEFVSARDNQDGVYGAGRTVNKTRWLQQAWWRYLQARWGYSPNIHSWELLNEGDPASTRHYELADEFGRYMHYRVFGLEPGASSDHPNDHLVTTSFWHSFPAAEFWTNSRYPFVDYADLHAYVSTTFAPGVEKRKMPWDAAYYHIWHSQAVAAGRVGKPIVRGEAGLDPPSGQNETALGLHRDSKGVWLHNFLWSGLDSGGLYEMYWWRSHIWNDRQDHRPMYRLINLFLSGLNLNRGGYVDWGGSVSTPGLRVVGQKNVASGMMHLWIQNARHTWKNVVDGQPIPPVSGDIAVSGFRPRAVYEVEWWETWSPAHTVRRVEEIAAGPAGDLNIRIDNLGADIALKVRPATRKAG